MKRSLFLALSYLCTAVWAGGYQGCLERVWLFQAYEIDALNPEMDQQIGFRCRKWIDADHKCDGGDGGYEACRGSRPDRRCTFDELMVHLGRAPQPRGWSATDPATGRLDTRQTAVNCYNIFQGRGRPVPNFPAYKAMKGNVWEYNDYILKLSTKVNDAFMKKKTDVNRYLWEDFDDTREKINVARAGDHGPHLIPAARANLNGITIHTQNLGNNPATGALWETVDWARTANDARANGVADAQTRIRDFLDDFYRGTANTQSARQARQHFQVFRTYKRVQDRTISCRKR